MKELRGEDFLPLNSSLSAIGLSATLGNFAYVPSNTSITV